MKQPLKPFSENAATVLCKRYLRPKNDARPACPRCGKAHESPEELFDRCSFGNDDFYNLLGSRDFLPNSPTLFNAGTGQGTFSGCFKFDVQDSMESIMSVAYKSAFVQKWGGGVGYCLSALRPYGAPIRTTHGKACGPIAVLKLYHAVSEMITQGGKRAGAQMGILHCDHPDIRQFIHCKDDGKGLETFNISVACTDEFMKAAATPGTSQEATFNEMVDSAWKTGDPGIYFIDTAEKANPTPWLGKLTATNPCIEENQLVLTRRGWIAIKDVILNDEVLGHDEQYHRVLRVIPQGVKSTVDVILRTGKVIRCTADHPYLIRGQKVLAKDLQKVEPISLTRRVIDSTSADYSNGFLDGSIYGDGSIGERVVFCGPIKTDVDRIAMLLNQRFGCNITVGRHTQISGSDIFRTQTGQQAVVDYYTTFNIANVKNASYDYQAGFLKGWFDSDGHLENNNGMECINLTIGENNSAGIHEIWYILQNFGIPAKIYYVVRKGHPSDEKYHIKSSNSFRVQVSGKFYNVLADLIQWAKKTSSSYDILPLIDVLEVRPSGEHVVYDLTVEGSHSFVVEGIKVSNCGEVPLLDNEPCNLGSINLGHMVVNGQFDEDKLKKTADLATRYLDTVLDNNAFPDPSITAAAKLTRKLGLGVMGWADMLSLLRIHYDTDEAVELARRIMCCITVTAHKTSGNLVTEKGPCPAGDGTKYNIPHGMNIFRRNATVTCIAPAGTICTLADCSSGIEPYLTLQGVRHMGDGTKLTESVRVDTGSFVPHTAHEIDGVWHVRHQAAFQAHTDLAVSKTVNLPNDATRRQIRDIYLQAWSLGCKGVTVYRNGSRAVQVVDVATPHIAAETSVHTSTMSKEELIVLAKSMGVPPEAVEEAQRRDVQTYKTDAQYGMRRHKMKKTAAAIRHSFAVGGMEGYVHVGFLPDNKPGEIFITGANQGSTISGLLASLSIMTSLALQYGVPLETMVSKLENIRFEPSGMTDDPEIPTASSIVAYIYRFLGRQFLAESTKTGALSGMTCPDCGYPTVMVEGCMKCEQCGWSKCG